jgi:hypothetical protein
MTRINEKADWFEQSDIDELDYYNGYCAFMEGGPDHWSEPGVQASKLRRYPRSSGARNFHQELISPRAQFTARNNCSHQSGHECDGIPNACYKT